MVDKLAGNRISPTFCVLPWVHRFTNIGGEIQVCCTAEEYHQAIPADDGSPLQITQCNDDHAIMNVQFMKDLRKKMLVGEWHPICTRCKETEEGAGNSRRHYENHRYRDVIDEIVASTHPDGSIETRVRSADFRLGNTCNLACRMCNPKSSARWVYEWPRVDHQWFGNSAEELAAFRGFDWYKNPEIWENFKKQIPTLRHLHFAGGEPLIVPQMTELLRICVQSGFAKNIELTYNTNITRISDELKELWPNFRIVRVLASVDAFGQMNEYIRHPSKWTEIDANLRDLDRNFHKYGLTEVMPMCTVQMYNILHLEPLYEYLADGFKNVAPVPHLINLHHPLYYRTQVLPKELKSLARERLSAIRKNAESRFASRRFSPRYHHVLNSVADALHFLDAEDMSERLPQFVRSCVSKDRVRGQNLIQHVPEYAAYV
jgi:organic radical activating enzyme